MRLPHPYGDSVDGVRLNMFGGLLDCYFVLCRCFSMFPERTVRRSEVGHRVRLRAVFWLTIQISLRIGGCCYLLRMRLAG